ncbi:membrane protein insertase YidC [Sphingomonas sp. BIUV-7]|uniref:Membrane protein insertase YidC n=1 Tax=Sphingomonas natans TaxID=3063330 RepID=A0ABT8Y3X6_9SPHN|nr:membrane protein insertase YidC [Sphingomonas sp. BIUV-7]MDO6413014.1 membrane protein insertase YidC [Sphingomonas sp. BIUV-7]
MQNQRNLILAIVLSAIVLIGWTFLSERFLPPSNPPATKIVDGKIVPLPKPEAMPDSATTVRDRALVMRETPRVAIATPRVAGSINLKGARIDDLVLLDHRETVAKNSPPVRLLSPRGTPDAYFAGFGWSGDNIALPGDDTVWTADGTRLTPTTPVTLRWDNGQGQRFAMRVAIDANYMFTVTQTVENLAPQAIGVRPYGLVSRVGISKDPSSWTMHTGPIGTFNGATDYSVSFKDLDKAGAPGQRFETTGGWIGFGDKYWQTALVPPQNIPVGAGFRAGDGGRYQADVAAPLQKIAPRSSASVEQRFFAGAKEVSVLDAYQAQGVAKFDRAVDWGWFVWFEKPIFYLLDWLFTHVGNFGVAIILLTCCVRALLFPVAQKQFASMASMRKVQPKMKALQERHKDDKPRLQQEMLKLYQAEKVNPVAGCLPIFIQMPIFIALYKVLMLSIEMRHQPFALWIRDLSSPDPLTPINLFGVLPFDPPGFLHLGVLAILLGVTMWLQFKMNPPAGDPAQQQVMQIMPWMMMLFFAPLAAGLQLYYVANNLLSLAQQQYLYRRTPGLRESMSAQATGK